MKHLRKFGESIHYKNLSKSLKSLYDEVRDISERHLAFLSDTLDIQYHPIGKKNQSVVIDIKIQNRVAYWEDISYDILPFIEILSNEFNIPEIIINQLDSDFNSVYPYKDFRLASYTKNDILLGDIKIAALRGLKITVKRK